MTTPKSQSKYEMEPLTDKDKMEVAEGEKPPGDTALLQAPMTMRLFFACFVCAMGSSFQFGFNLGVINTPELAVRKWINESHFRGYNETMTEEKLDFTWSAIVSTFAIGGMIGGLVSGFIADKYGRKGGMMLNNFFALVAAACLGLAKTADAYQLLIVGRVIIGFNSGLNSGLAPMYLTEVSPINLRGAVGSCHQLVVTISILIAQILGLGFLLGNENGWPILFALTAIPAVFQLILLPLCPESPKYNLIVKNRVEQAELDLRRLRDKEDVAAEMESMQREADHARSVRSVGWLDMFRYPMLWPLSISVVMMLSQQFSGINVAVFYSSNIFRSVNLSAEVAKVGTLVMGAMNVGMTVVSTLIVDRFGRRLLHLAGLSGMCICSLLLVVFMTLQNAGHAWAGYPCILWVVLFVVSFATGPGSIPWFFVSELFRQNARGHANSIAIAINWTATFIVAQMFLPLKGIMGHLTFLVFTTFLVIFIIYTWMFVPETKGSTIDTIVKRFEEKKYFAKQQ